MENWIKKRDIKSNPCFSYNTKKLDRGRKTFDICE